jgi:hypothetical protein
MEGGSIKSLLLSLTVINNKRPCLIRVIIFGRNLARMCHRRPAKWKVMKQTATFWCPHSIFSPAEFETWFD